MSTHVKPGSVRISHLAVLLLCLALMACGNGGGDDAEYNPGTLSDETTNFTTVYRRALTEDELSGLLAPEIQAKLDNYGNAHLIFYTRGQDLDITALAEDHDLRANPMRFQINHIEFNPVNGHVTEDEMLDPAPPQTMSTAAVATDSGIDNCLLLGLSMTVAGEPVVVYQGGVRSEFVGGQNCNPLFQGDLMVSTRTGGYWQEYLGIQGDAGDKNPLHPNGMVGMAGDVAVDNQGNIHMIAQHYYEWCDLNALNHPDLIYVQQSPDMLGTYSPDWEEAVDQVNLYGTGGGVQSSLGYRCRLILDNNEPQQPIAFYAGNTSNGPAQLRASRRVEGVWQQEVVYTVPNDFVVEFISPAMAPDGTLGVAYFLKRTNAADDEMGDHLNYAQRQQDGTWINTIVDYQSYCGDYCSLSFDSNNQPAIAYYDERPYTPYRERHNVKLAYLMPDGDWQKENVAFHGRIGFYNWLWFDGANIPCVVSYEIEKIENSDGERHSIVFFRRDRILSR